MLIPSCFLVFVLIIKWKDESLQFLASVNIILFAFLINPDQQNYYFSQNTITEQEPLATDEQGEAYDRNVPNTP